MIMFNKVTGEYVAHAMNGRVRFLPYGVRQLTIVLEFERGGAHEGLAVCRDALRYLFTNTDTLVIWGNIEPYNLASRLFGNTLGFSTVESNSKTVVKRITKARWEKLYG